MIDDRTLLRRYAEERAEDAFAEFVRRHLPLVYSAALRRLGGDAHRAEDVAQAVFCAAAREANRLSCHAMVVRWLYAATRNAVIDVRRSEERRRIREREAHLMEDVMRDAGYSVDWTGLAPVLDAALDELNDDDRSAVLLRFFQNRAFAEIGRGLGLNEDAARKRVERALDKLRARLRRQGIGSTSAALATLLAGNAVNAVPAGLASSVTGMALAAGGAAVGTAAVFTVSKLQVGLAAVVVAGGSIGLVSQQRSLHAMREASAEARQQVSALRESEAAAQQQIARLTEENAASARVRAEAETDVAKLRAELSALRKSPGTVSGGAETVRGTMVNLGPAANTLGPLPDTPEIRKMKARWYHRYEAFFQERGMTRAQSDRFVELKVHQALAREEFQAAVRAANLRGDSARLQALRAKDDSPVTQGLLDLLGEEGYAAYGKYEMISYYREAFVEPLQPKFISAKIPLSNEQAEQLLQVVMANVVSTRAHPTDIGMTDSMNWNAVAAQSTGILTPDQLKVLEDYARRQSPVSANGSR